LQNLALPCIPGYYLGIMILFRMANWLMSLYYALHERVPHHLGCLFEDHRMPNKALWAWPTEFRQKLSSSSPVY
jgi:hypothetical protein